MVKGNIKKYDHAAISCKSNPSGSIGTIPTTANPNRLNPNICFHILPFLILWFSSKKEGWIVGWKGVILRSVDAGHTWRREQSPTNKTLNSLWITRGKIPWVVGESGLILKYNRD